MTCADNNFQLLIDWASVLAVYRKTCQDTRRRELHNYMQLATVISAGLVLKSKPKTAFF